MTDIRVERIREALEKLQLNPMHLNVILDNPSKDNPYHNNAHLYTVALNCLEAAEHYGMEKKEQRILFIAGLYHDYAHSGGMYSDTINVSQSISHALNHCEELESFSVEEKDLLANTIHATIQPSKLHNDNLTLMQKIIMDADMMQWLEHDADVFLAGLSLETGQEITWETTEVFLSNHQVKTSWGKRKIMSLLKELRGV